MGRGSSDRRVPHLAGRASVLLATLLLVSCGGGGGGSDPITCTSISFARALGTPGSGDVYLNTASADCSTIKISVIINNLSRIYTVGFDLNFPSSLLSFDSCTVGPLMQKGSPANPIRVFCLDSGGSLHVSVSRFGSDPPVDAVGSETLITFQFTRVAAGSGGIDFDVSPSSPSAEAVIDDGGGTRPATFAPGHGGLVTVP